MKGCSWTKEEDNFLIENYPFLETNEIAKILNRSKDSVVHRTRILKDRGFELNKLYNGKYRKWTQEEDLFIIENYNNLGSNKTVKEIESRFGIRRTTGALKLHVYNLNQKLNLNLRVSDECISNINATNNKMASVPIGTIVYWQCPGNKNIKEAYIKTSSDKRYGWVMLKRYIMGNEANNKCVIFLNGDRTDFRKENLACITNETNVRMKDYGFYSEDPEVTKAGITWCELAEALRSQGIDTKELIRNMEKED